MANRNNQSGSPTNGAGSSMSDNSKGAMSGGVSSADPASVGLPPVGPTDSVNPAVQVPKPNAGMPVGQSTSGASSVVGQQTPSDQPVSSDQAGMSDQTSQKGQQDDVAEKDLEKALEDLKALESGEQPSESDKSSEASVTTKVSNESGSGTSDGQTESTDSLDLSYPDAINNAASFAESTESSLKQDDTDLSEGTSQSEPQLKSASEDYQSKGTGSSIQVPAEPTKSSEPMKTEGGVKSGSQVQPVSGASGKSLADLAKKLSNWKDDFMSGDSKKGQDDKRAQSRPQSVDSPVVGTKNAEADLPGTQSPTPAVTPAPAVGSTSQPPVGKAETGSKEPTAVMPKGKEMGGSQQSVNTLPKQIASEAQKPVVQEEIPKSSSTGKMAMTMDQLLQTIVDKDSSDLHITVGYPPMMRIDGLLTPIVQEIITEEDAMNLIAPLLPENKRELLEVNREVDLSYAYKDVARFRVNAYYERDNPAAALRLIPSRIRSIEELKLPGVYHQFVNLPQGLVLVTGPTGHGKSTTLAAIIQEINTTLPKHIITIEDPIEYIYPPSKALIDQREMHEDTHSWEIALRSAMRQDPDVVLVGEMRDFETIASAITLAETGHLVFATLHTNNAAQTIDRVVDVFPEHQQAQVRTQLSNILEAVISQRLIPIIGGGRRAVSEVLLATPAVRSLIREGKSHQIDNVIRTSVDVGMKSLEHSLVDLVREGVITMEDAEAFAVHPEEVVRLLK